jgi:two-component system, OmpR family, response regulator
MPVILAVEDSLSIRNLIKAYLLRDGYKVETAANGREALGIIDKTRIDLMIADIMMPGMDGFALTRELRSAGHAFPVLMVTAKESIRDKREGFASGTDDYMVKPIDFDEMLLRVAALLRRAKIANEHRIELGGVLVDSSTLTVTRDGTETLLPKKEFLLLFKLLSYPGRIFTRQELLDDIWGYDSETDERTVDVHIKRLREKFEGYTQFRIVTIRGLGYKAEKTA